MSPQVVDYVNPKSSAPLAKTKSHMPLTTKRFLPRHSNSFSWARARASECVRREAAEWARARQKSLFGLSLFEGMIRWQLSLDIYDVVPPPPRCWIFHTREKQSRERASERRRTRRGFFERARFLHQMSCGGVHFSSFACRARRCRNWTAPAQRLSFNSLCATQFAESPWARRLPGCLVALLRESFCAELIGLFNRTPQALRACFLHLRITTGGAQLTCVVGA